MTVGSEIVSNSPHEISEHCRYVEDMALIVGIEENCLAQKVSIMEGRGLSNFMTGGCLYITRTGRGGCG